MYTLSVLSELLCYVGRTHSSSGPECGWFTAEPGTSLFLRLLLPQVLKDCELVSSECGGTVSTHSLLMALHSPLLASLLGEHSGTLALSLPLPLPASGASYKAKGWGRGSLIRRSRMQLSSWAYPGMGFRRVLELPERRIKNCLMV